MPSNPLQTELVTFFEQRNYQAVLDRAKADEITPASDPQAGNVVAASLFQLGRYPECLLWCEGLEPAPRTTIIFINVWRVLRRTGRFDEAESL